MSNKDLGNSGETIASTFLKENKYIILQKNYKNKYGEIDIIIERDELIAFVEVKTRTSTKYGTPSQAVDHRKQNTIGKVASKYITENEFYNKNFRFDVIEVLINKGESTISHIQNAFQPKIM